MRARVMVSAVVLALCSTSNAADGKEEGRFGAKPLKGDYCMHGGTPGEMTPPSPKDRKMSLMLTRAVAK